MLGETLLVSIIIRAQDLASQVFAKLGLTMGTVAGQMQLGAVAAAAAVATIGVEGVKQAVSFDQAMAKIGALTTTSADQLTWYKNQILQMGPQIDMSATQMALQAC